MTRPQLTPSGGVFAAIDVAKARNEVLTEVPGSGRRGRLSVLSSPAEPDRVMAFLSDLGQPVTCGFKAIGNYHRPVIWRLLILLQRGSVTLNHITGSSALSSGTRPRR